jgi:SPP1 gp7 family putative phage head morphogenesis protein
MNQNEKFFEEFLTQSLRSLRVDAKFRKQILSDLSTLEKKLTRKIRDDADNLSSFKLRRFNNFIKEINQIISTAYKEAEISLAAEVKSYIAIEAKKTSNVVSEILEISSKSLSVAQINSVYSEALVEGAISKEWWSRQSEKLKRVFKDNMRQGIILGETNQQLVRRLRGSKALNYTDGIMNISRRDSDALVRSSVQSVSNNARYKTLEANASLIEFYQHVSTLDSRTSTVCAVRDGLRWYADSKKPYGHNIAFQVPPIHWNCRSTLIPIIKGVELPDDPIRASSDGPVKANLTFEKFMKKKPIAFQEEILGVEKAKLWRNGKISLRQLLDQKGNELSLSELKDLYNL